MEKSLNREKGMILSIIVPVYNVEKYLEESLVCLEKQTLSTNLFEVLLIDDKSTDASLDICKEFVNRNKNFKLIELQEHSPGGCGTASNKGIEVARGKYIGFLDSDDKCVINMFEILLTKALETNSDIIMCDYSEYDLKAQKEIPSCDRKDFKELALTAEKLIDQTLKEKILKLTAMPWRKLYKASLIKDLKIFFPENDIFFEDLPFHWYTTVSASSFSFVDMPLVVHSVHREGQTIDPKFKTKRPHSYITIAFLIDSYLKNNKLYDFFKISYVSTLLDLLKCSTRNFFPGYKHLVRTALDLIPNLNIKDIIKLIKLRDEKFFKIPYYLLFLVLSPYLFILIRTLLISSNLSIRKYFK